MACSTTAVSRFIGHLFDTPQRSIVRCGKAALGSAYTLWPAESLHWRAEIGMGESEGQAGLPPGIGSASEKQEANPMVSNITIIFNFIISQWSLTPQAFKEAVLAAALAKCVLAGIWWTTRMLIAKFPPNATLSVFQDLLNTRAAKRVVLGLDITLIDVFLFFAVVGLLDLRPGFSVFSLCTPPLFSFLPLS